LEKNIDKRIKNEDKYIFVNQLLGNKKNGKISTQSIGANVTTGHKISIKWIFIK
jgi:hypothetical protein